MANRIAVALDVLSGAGVFYASRRAKVDFSGRMVPVMGVLAASVFAAQMLNFPIIGGTSGHLIGGTLLAILLGPMAGFLTMSTVVIAQALLLQDGGLVALGANIFNICAVTCFGGFAVFRLLGGDKAQGKRLLIAGFLSGWLSPVLSAGCCAVEMGISGAIPLRLAMTTMLGYHMVVGIVEGFLTAGVLSFLLKVRPDLMKLNGSSRFEFPDWIGAVVFVAIPVAILALAGSSSLPDSLQKLLVASPLVSGSAEPEKLSSSSRYMDYILRAGVFVLLIGLAFAAGVLRRRRSSRA